MKSTNYGKNINLRQWNAGSLFSLLSESLLFSTATVLNSLLIPNFDRIFPLRYDARKKKKFTILEILKNGNMQRRYVA